MLAPIRILLVDDFQLWRHLVESMLKKHTEVRLVGEAADGLAAIQRAFKLKPDLILMDIGLPNLNGIHAAEQIRRSIPSTKILFLAFNNDSQVIQMLLDSGAHGYVLKTDAATELLPAIEAVV